MNIFKLLRVTGLSAAAVVSIAFAASLVAQTPAPATAVKPAATKPAPKKAPEKAKANFCKPETKGTPVKVKLTTSMGAMTLELNSEKAPISVENFVKYVESGH